MKGRIYFAEVGSTTWRDIGVGEVTLAGPDFEPGDVYYQDSSGTIRSTTTYEEFRPCYRCYGRGRCKLRKRSRGKGRYGSCPNCEGRGGRWTNPLQGPSSVTFTIDEVSSIDPEMLKLFFNGS